MISEPLEIPQTSLKRKVLIAITKSNWGGAQRHVYDLATSLDKNTYDVSVLCGGNGMLYEKLKQTGIQVQSLETLGRDIRGGKDLRALTSLVSYLRKERPDILHLNSSKMGFLGVIAGRLARVPRIIFTAHGWAFTEERSWFETKAFFILQAITVALSHQTIAVSKETKDFMRALPFITKKIVVIPNGIGTEPAIYTKESARDAITRHLVSNPSFTKKLVERPLWIGTISELHRNKGLSYALEAIAEIRKRKPETSLLFLLIGEGEERASLEIFVKENNLQDSIFLCGYVPNAGALLPALDIFTLTSITEGLPYVLLEAGKIGLPVISSAVGGIPEIITDMQSGILLRPRKPSEIANAICFYREKPEKAVLFGETLKKNIEETFSLTKMVARIAKVYENK